MPRAEREIAFTAKDGITLAGSVLVPEGWQGGPAAVIQAGSVLCDRDGNVPRTGTRSTLYRTIARRLELFGIATLRYDKRQFDRPAPLPLDYTLAQRAMDLNAAWHATCEHLGVKPSIVAHSEGGLVAMRAVGTIAPPRAVILGTPAATLLHSMAWRVERQASGGQTLSVSRARTRIGLVQRLSERLQEGERVDAVEQAALLEDMRAQGVLQGWESWDWLAEHAHYDVEEAAQALQVSTLVIHGARDRIVDPRAHERFREILAGRSDATFRFAKFQDMGHNGEDTTRKAFTLRDDVIESIAAWVGGADCVGGHSPHGQTAAATIQQG